MDEQQDPMALWVGTWTPEDAIDVEARRLSLPRTQETEKRSLSDSVTDGESGRR